MELASRGREANKRVDALLDPLRPLPLITEGLNLRQPQERGVRMRPVGGALAKLSSDWSPTRCCLINPAQQPEVTRAPQAAVRVTRCGGSRARGRSVQRSGPPPDEGQRCITSLKSARVQDRRVSEITRGKSKSEPSARPPTEDPITLRT